jgi:hypothetical protein
MLSMLDTLKGPALYVAGALVLALIGAATYLSAQGILTGEAWLVIVTPIITGVVGVTSAHVAGTQAVNALMTPPPATAVTPPPLAQPEGDLPIVEAP